jgi:hypothetical protein
VQDEPMDTASLIIDVVSAKPVLDIAQTTAAHEVKPLLSAITKYDHVLHML